MPLTDEEAACVRAKDTYVDATFGYLSGSSNHSKSNLAARTNMSEIRRGTEPRQRTDVQYFLIFDTALRARPLALQ